MICPNKNSKEWKELVEKFGESGAYSVFRMGGVPTSSLVEEATPLFDRIYKLVSEDPEYYSKKYATYLTNKIDTITPYNMAMAFYFRAKSLNKLDTANLFPPSNVEFKKAVTVPKYFAKVLDDLKSRFGVDYLIVDDKESKHRGMYVNADNKKLVVINIAHATLDTPFHEYYHPFVRLLMINNPDLYESLLNQANVKTEEQLVQKLGEMAAAKFNPSYLQRFLAFVDKILNTISGRKNTLNSNSTLEEVVTYLLNEDVDVSSENTLMSAFQAKKIYEGATKIERASFVKDVIALLKGASVSITTNDDTSFYQDTSGTNIAKRLTAFVGDKIEGVFSIRTKDKPSTYYEHQARLMYAENRIPTNENINYAGRSVSYDDLVSILETEANINRLFGKAGHALFQYLIEKDTTKKVEAKKMFDDYVAEMARSGKDPRDLAVVEEDFEVLLKKIGIDADDRVASELAIVSDELVTNDGFKIGTTADGVVQHRNGEITLFDLKFGNIVSDMYINRIMQYANGLNIKDSKLSRAYLELAFRAMMIKEKFPDARFRSIKLVKVDVRSNHRVFEVDLGSYLELIENFYLKENPELAKKLGEKGMFTASNYMGASAAAVKYTERMKDMSMATKLEYVEEKLKELTLRSKNRSADTTTMKEERAVLAELYQELSASPEVDLKRDTDDLSGIFGKYTKNLSDISHPRVQQLHVEIQQVRNRMRKEFQEINKTEQDLFKKVLLESAKDTETRNFIKKISTGALAGTIVAASLGASPLLIGLPLALKVYMYRTSISPKELFGFMWRKDARTDVGYYLNTLDTYTTKDGREVPLTEAQKAYRSFVTSTMAQKYSDLMSTKAYMSDSGKVITYAKMLEMPETLPEDFLPRTPKSTDELRLDQNFTDNVFGLKTRYKDFIKRNLTDFFEDEVENTKDTGGLPLRYMKHAGSTIVEGEHHTFNVSEAFNLFMGSMLNKEYYDPLYSLAVGVNNSIELAMDESGKQRYPKLKEFLDNQIMLQILKDAPRDRVTSNPIQVKLNKVGAAILGLPEGHTITFNQHKALMSLKYGVSFAVMSFKLVGATFNGALAGLTNAMNASKAAIGSILGIPPEDLRATTDSAFTAYKDYADYLAASMKGKDSKLGKLAEKFDWIPDSFDYTYKPNSSLLYDVTSPSLFSHAFMFHNATENYASMINLSMMMRSTFIETSKGDKISLWDAYDNEGNWKESVGSRGFRKVGDSVIELKELDDLEIKSLKRQHEKMHGSYRAEEKIAMEASVIGQFIVQFKKFFFSYLKNLYGSSYKDITVGRYVVDHSIKRPDGMPVWKWESEIHHGRLNVLMGAVMNAHKLKDYLGTAKTATKVQRGRQLRMIELANTAIWFMTLSLLLMAGFDDKEEKTYAFRRMQRLRDDLTQGLSIRDLASSIQQPVAAADKTAKTLKAFSEWIMFDYNKDGSRKGAAELSKNIPILSNIRQLENFFSTADAKQEYLFGIIPSAGEARNK